MSGGTNAALLAIAFLLLRWSFTCSTLLQCTVAVVNPSDLMTSNSNSGSGSSSIFFKLVNSG